MSELTEEKWKRLDEALPDIPNRDNIPREFSKTLFERYKYAETHGWSELVRVTTTTIKSRYWGGLYKFIDWAIQEKHYGGSRYAFECIDPENLAPLPRDAFDDGELLTLLKQPLFTGCKNRTHVWQEGGYFVQSHIYWGFLICILTGMRTGEVGQLKCADIRTDGESFYFNLRPFDARNGRVALEDLRNRKTNAGGLILNGAPFRIRLRTLMLLKLLYAFHRHLDDRIPKSALQRIAIAASAATGPSGQVHHLILFHPDFRQFSRQGPAMHPKPARRLRDVEVRVHQNLMDMLPFEILDRCRTAGKLNRSVPEGSVKGGFDVVRFGRLRKIVTGTKLDRFHGGRDARKSCKHDNFHEGIVLMKDFNAFQPRAADELEINDGILR
jgi:integrase